MIACFFRRGVMLSSTFYFLKTHRELFELRLFFGSYLCSNPKWRLRREAVAGTVKAFPLKNGDKIYGVIISGEHVFYVTELGNAEFLDGRANFTEVWLMKNGDYKMARILSYNHHPATPVK